ncbi:putative exocyst complex component Exo70, cullin repeat-like-containing domain superfamily [Arabidopsis thaliana]
MIFQSDRDEVDRFLRAVDEIQRSLSSVSFSSSSSSAATSAATVVDEHEVKANSAIQIAMARLEDEFRNILLSHTTTFEPDSLFLEEPSVSPSLNRRSWRRYHRNSRRRRIKFSRWFRFKPVNS